MSNAQNMQIIPLALIHASSTLNPRKHRNAARFEQLVESIKSQGVIQPIVVRPSLEQQGHYEVVAGSSRFEASQLANAEGIPAVIRDLNDTDAKLVAAIENLQRADLSPIEEAWVAADMMELHHQNHDEARKQLGWSRSKLDNRLMLSHCTEAVSAALIDGKIKIGHAELLAALSKGNQDKILGRIIEDEMSVDQAKERLGKVTTKISTACFDTTECQTCRHNSASTFDMFGDGDGRCHERTCWDKKTRQQLDIIVTDAREEYGVAHLDTEITADGYKLIEPNGDNGVGNAQADACLTCEHYGAVVASGMGREGKIMPGVCFNLTCHAEKREGYQTMLSAVSEDTPAAASATPDATNESGNGKSAPAKKGAKTPKAGKPATLKKGIKRQAFDRFATAAEHTVKQNPVGGLAIAVAELLKNLNIACGVKYQQKITDVLKAYTIDPTQLGLSYSRMDNPEHLLAFAALGPKALCNLLVELGSLMAYRTDGADQFEASQSGKTNLALLDAFNANTAQWEVVNKEYLDAQTKGAIVADAKASGFAAAYDQAKGEGAFADLAKGKAGALKAAILEFTEFDWTGYEPTGFALTDYGFSKAAGGEANLNADAVPAETQQPQGAAESQQAAPEAEQVAVVSQQSAADAGAGDDQPAANPSESASTFFQDTFSEIDASEFGDEFSMDDDSTLAFDEPFPAQATA